MIVVVSEYIPPAVRGRMKLWFIEPKPNVFVSGVKDAVAQKVVEYLYDYCPPESNLVIIHSTGKPPYYKIRFKGFGPKRIRFLGDFPVLFDMTRKQ